MPKSAGDILITGGSGFIGGAITARLIERTVALAGLKVAGLMLGDVVLTADEIRGLTREYLCSASPDRRGVDFAEWLADRRVASELGKYYASELARHFDRAPTRS